MPATAVLEATLVTLRVGIVATLLNAVPGICLGWVLARGSFRGRTLLQTLVALPMVLPPVAVGLVLLLALSRDAPLGRAAASLLGGPILLTWWAAALAAAVMSFPFVVLGAQQGFAAVPRRLEQVAASLGASPRAVFFRVSLPLASRSILYGLVFAFARSLGEFGATSIVAGRIPGETETLALAIHSRIETFETGAALQLAAVSTVLALVITGLAEAWLRARHRP